MSAPTILERQLARFYDTTNADDARLACASSAISLLRSANADLLALANDLLLMPTTGESIESLMRKASAAKGEFMSSKLNERLSRLDTELQANIAAERLRDAAPELLAALKLALDIIENDDGMSHGTEPIRAAIARAEGQS